MKPFLAALLLALLFVVGASQVDAQSDTPSASLSDFTFGDHVSGAEVTPENLEGRVVAIEFWGTR